MPNTKKKYAKFPERIYAVVEHDDGEDWLLAIDDAERAPDGKVAVYSLIKVVTKSTKAEFDSPL